MDGKARELATALGINGSNFDDVAARIDQRTNERLTDGTWDEVVYYLLQSRSFTQATPIEPARSAAEWIPRAMSELPLDVVERIEAFLGALASPSNERLSYFAKLKPTKNQLALQYRRTMNFLYKKEVECRESDTPQACIAELYAGRGLSSDTSQQAFRVVEAAAQWLGKPGKVLILGPGVDFSPRTGLQENGPPRLYQPVQVLQLFHPKQVDCVDVNPQVIAYAKSACTSVYQVNIATGFVQGDPGWDLIIATNVLLYLNDTELLLAMNNVRQMLKPGGIFLHNDGRFAVQVFGKACGMPVIRFGDLTLDAKRSPPLTDRFVLHRAGAI